MEKFGRENLEGEVFSLLERISKQWGLGKSVGRVWGFLLFESKPVTQREIESKVGYSRGLVSICLNKLKELGLIKSRKEGNEILYEANFSLIEGFHVVVRSFLEREIEPFIHKLKSSLAEIDDPILKERARNAVIEYEKLKLSIRIFSSKIKKVSKLSLNSLEEIALLHNKEGGEEE